MKKHIFIFSSLVASLAIAACSSTDSTSNASDAGVADSSSQPGVDGSSGGDAAPSADASSGSDGSSAADSASGIDSGATDSAASQDVIDDLAVTDSGNCNALVNGGPAVPEIQVPQNPPTVGQGGTIALGVYYLTGWTNFTGPGGATGPSGNNRKTAFQFGSSVYYKVTADNGLTDEHDTRLWSTQGTTLVSNQICPTNDMLSSEYTVNGNTLTLIAGTEQLVFTHQ